VTIAERFWARIDQNGPVPRHAPELGPCWLWTGGKTRAGYGHLREGGCTGKHVYAHRVSWELRHGTIPPGLHVLHRCDTPRCVNPAHLFVGTHADNMADRDAKGRQARGSRSGAHTHPERRATGERHGSRTHPERYHYKLTPDQVRSIRARYAAGSDSQGRLAREHGVTLKAIWKVVHLLSWRTVSGAAEVPR